MSDQGWFLDKLTCWSGGLRLQPDTFENFMQELISDWHTENRYYRLHLHQDLFGDWVLHRVWGSRKSRAGRSKVEVFNCFEEGEKALVKLEKVRKGRGYEVI